MTSVLSQKRQRLGLRNSARREVDRSRTYEEVNSPETLTLARASVTKLNDYRSRLALLNESTLDSIEDEVEALADADASLAIDDELREASSLLSSKIEDHNSNRERAAAPNIANVTLNETQRSDVEVCIDVGCGPGTTTEKLSPHFSSVTGIDTSEGQIDEAKAITQNSNVKYRVGSSDDLGAKASSVDLVTSFVAAHWFDRPKFVAECDRVLKPGGVVALCSYTDFPTILCSESKEVEEGANKIHLDLMTMLRNENYFANDKLLIAFNKYNVYDDLFADMDSTSGNCRFESNVEYPTTLGAIIKFIESSSGIQNYQKKHPEESIIEDAEKQLRDLVTKHNCAEDSFTIRYPWFCVCYKKRI